MTEYLFIGGVADGRMIATDGSPRIRVPVPHNPFCQMGYQIERQAIEIHDYQAHRLHEGGAIYKVYVLSDSDTPVIQQLIAGYRREVANA